MKRRSHEAKDLGTRKYAPRVVPDKRRREIVRELSRLSRDGWANARHDDYHHLEKELRGD